MRKFFVKEERTHYIYGPLLYRVFLLLNKDNVRAFAKQSELQIAIIRGYFKPKIDQRVKLKSKCESTSSNERLEQCKIFGEKCE